MRPGFRQHIDYGGMFPIDLLIVVAIGYAAAVLFFLALRLEPRPRSAAFVLLGAYSPAEFWRRWNRPMYRWFLENVYRPAGGRRNSGLAALAPFALSGLLHEYLYAVTLRRVTGYVTAFFLLHGVPALLTRRLRPEGCLVVPAVLLTFAVNSFSTVLLLLPIHERIPLYVNDVPKWLRLW